ncbi:cyclase family protein [Mycolicibacterium hodleri]|uniref:Cyclase family protein n=1 Tax=Mycolicibacterium hodleri TaxID=49897 RepID=A0A502E5F1_9MYCO|nr:cyclase family protein [Mycolicibacterium hodleri]TPG32574.1 cyclase family protein [Mycolicibacterium hodleri]
MPADFDFRAVGRQLTNWGRWGDDDRIGTLNHITPDAVVSASQLIKQGKIFDLSIPLGANGPAAAAGGRSNPIHLMSITPGDTHILNSFVSPTDVIVADDWITMPLQCATQWDGLAHVGYDGSFYNNVPSQSVSTFSGSTVLAIGDIIAKGPTGRGVLLDITALHDGKPLEVGYEITAAELEAAEDRQDVRVGVGDILLIRTGWIQQFTIHKSAATFNSGEPGIGMSCLEWLHEREVAAVASDNWGIEVVPVGTMLLICHCVLIRDMGMTMGETFDLDALAADCEADGVWDFFFTSPPLKVENAVGSPITPLAIK